MILDSRKVFQYFRSNYVLSKPSNGWYSFTCPFCGKKDKMSVNFGYLYTKCWSCSAKANVMGFVMAIEDCDYDTANGILWNQQIAFGIDVEILEELNELSTHSTSEVRLPEGFKTLTEGTTAMGKRARRYLEKRDMDLKLLESMGFGYCNKEAEEFNEDFYGYIIIPFISSGKLVYFIGRDYIDRGDKWRYKNPAKSMVGIGKADVIFNEEAFHLYKEAFCFEGWACAITIGKKAGSLQGWNISSRQKDIMIKSHCNKLVFGADAGADPSGVTYYQKAVKASLDFIDAGKQVYVVDLNIPEFEELGKDANEIGKENFMRKYKEDTPPMTWGNAMDIIM